jgi:hypothetical protein
MARSMTNTATRATARSAGVAALLVGAVMLVQTIIHSAIDAFGLLAYAASPLTAGYRLRADDVASLASTATGAGFSIVPLALGVFLAFWLVVPITAELSVTRVVLHSIAAAGIAAAVALAVGVISAVGRILASAGPLFGNAFPRPDGSILGRSLFEVVQSVLFTCVAVTPVVVLAGLVVWLWMARIASGTLATGEVTRNP